MPQPSDILLITSDFSVMAAVAYGVLNVSAATRNLDKQRRSSWLAITVIACGSSIWAAHDIGGFGFGAEAPPKPTTLAAINWLISIAIAAVMVAVCSSHRPTLGHLLIAGAACGGSLTALCYGYLFTVPSALGYLDPHEIGNPTLIFALACSLIFILAANSDGPPASARAQAILTCAGLLSLLHAIALFAGHPETSLPHFALGRNDIGAAVIVGIIAIAWIMLYLIVRLARNDARLAHEYLQITHELAESERLYRLAYYDRATGLPNRLLFTENLMRRLVSVNYSTDSGNRFTLIYAELGDQLRLAQHLGQSRFDRILKKITEHAAAVLEKDDIIARLAPNGLILLINESGKKDIDTVLHRLHAQLSAPVQDDGEFFRFNWGYGNCRFPDDGNSIQALLFSAMKLHSGAGNAAHSNGVTPSRYAPVI